MCGEDAGEAGAFEALPGFLEAGAGLVDLFGGEALEGGFVGGQVDAADIVAQAAGALLRGGIAQFGDGLGEVGFGERAFVEAAADRERGGEDWVAERVGSGMRSRRLDERQQVRGVEIDRIGSSIVHVFAHARIVPA